MKVTQLVNQFRAFHEDEDGIEAIQVVMVVAIAAIVLIAVMAVGQEVFTWSKDKWGLLQDKKIA